MGSTPSTPSRESGDDPWWPIENQNLDLNPNAMEETNSQNLNRVEEQGPIAHSDDSEDSISNRRNNSDDESTNNFEKMSSASSEKRSSISNSKSDAENNSPESSAAPKSSEIERSNRQQSLDEFKEELRIKREMRTNAIAELRNEITSLRVQLAEEKEITKQLKQQQSNQNLCQICNSIYESLENIESIDTNGEMRGLSVTLRSQLAELQFSLQNANAEILTLTAELAATKKQAKSLKEVIAASKEIIEIRETELSQLKSKLKEIENSLAEREMRVMSESLRNEYNRELANIRNLRALYEERARINAAEKENLNRQLETSRAELSSEIEKNKNLEDHITSLDADLKSTTTDLYAAKEQVTYYKGVNRGLHEEMAVINQLFSQLLAGFNGSNDIDIDKLTSMLEENRDLLNDITSKEYCKEGAAQIPKLIFDLVSQADKKEENSENENSTVDSAEPSTSTDEPKTNKVSSAQEIIHNLPKVWRVLNELLNHQQMKPVELNENNQQEFCYKSVQTPTGPQMVLSVSKTYIRLKDLIMEKKFLQKETRKLKNLNSHLGSRLSEQEQRLGVVTIELNKTWNLVGRMQRQHRQLHTHEQVLRYQLQQKRRMLGELKEELEYCRRKWALAKEKNNESQSQWETLRLEFSKRKENDLNNSGESGYSDSPASEDDDEEDSCNSIEAPRNSRMKKKITNMEQFLLTNDQKDRKVTRIQSVSPARSTKETLVRRNSDSHVTLFATEVFQNASDEVQPIVHQTVCADCGENCVKHSVHFDSAEHKKTNDLVKVSKPVVRKELTNAQKLIEAKASSSKTKMCCELRKTVTTPKPTTSKKTHTESLEEMFLRLSGSTEASESEMPATVEIQEDEEQSASEASVDEIDGAMPGDQVDGAIQRDRVDGSIQEDQTDRATLEDQIDNEQSVPLSPEERQTRRLARIERLEGQCKQLLKQVTRASNRGDELNRRINEVHSRYTPVRETSSDVEEPQPSTSRLENANEKATKSDEQCLSATEQEYLARRDERLKRLEAESQAYMNRVKSTNRRATDVDTKLEFLHGRYGSETDGEDTVDKVDGPSSGCASEASESNTDLLTTESVTQESPSEIDSSMNTSQASTSSIQKSNEQPTKSDEQCLTDTEREYLARREERLKRLEAESKAYTERLKSMNQRVTDADTKLEILHGRFASESNGEDTVDNAASTSTEVLPEDSSNHQNQSDANQSAEDVPPSNENNKELPK